MSETLHHCCDYYQSDQKEKDCNCFFFPASSLAKPEDHLLVYLMHGLDRQYDRTTASHGHDPLRGSYPTCDTILYISLVTTGSFADAWQMSVGFPC